MARLLLLAPLLLLAACSSQRSGTTSSDPNAPEQKPTPGEPVRMTVYDYRTPIQFELVNQSHTTKVDQYSKVRKLEEASRKVQEDEVMAALLVWENDNGFQKFAQQGSAPALRSGMRTWALEIETPAGTRYIMEASTASVEDKKQMRKLRDAVIEIFNNTQSWQAVDVQDPNKLFRQNVPAKQP
jgi:hypothetical protein